jgi:hypothetical protein
MGRLLVYSNPILIWVERAFWRLNRAPFGGGKKGFTRLLVRFLAMEKTKTKKDGRGLGRWVGGMIVVWCVILFVWQLYCEVNNVAQSPAFALEMVKERLCDGFEKIGEFIAFASSYLQWLNAEILWRTIVHLCKPLVGILFSWTSGLSGYFWAACTYYGNSTTIYVGTAIPILLLCGLLYVKRAWVSRYVPLPKWDYESTTTLFATFVIVFVVGIAVATNRYKNMHEFHG